ncbi:MAG: FtsW/RodA/SpoVE family cell cycle protein, partial [Candidatus Neomarinimicrobiota bacterium]
IFVSILLLIVTKLLYLAEGNRSSARWLHFGPLTFQTSDFARFSIIVYLAGYLDKKRDQIRDFVNGFLPPLVITGLVMALIIIQPDFSTAAILGMIVLAMLFMGGAKLAHLIAAGSVSVAILVPVLLTAQYRLERIKSFLSADSSLHGLHYQLQQSLFSLGNGGISGVGLGESVGKNLFLPTPHTDFILSIIGEEFGFVGTFFVITMFLALFQRSVHISKHCTDVFGILLGMGLSIKIMIYAFVNSAVVTGLVPTTGLPIPLVSYGGSGLVTNLLSVGILLNISMAKRSVRPAKTARILFG